jgi:hypothetical protein
MEENKFDDEYTKLVDFIKTVNMAGKNSKQVIFARLALLRAMYHNEVITQELKELQQGQQGKFI